MSEEPTDPVALYAWLKQKISELEKKLDAVKDEVFSIVEKDGGQMEQDRFVFKITKRPKYKFSADYDQKNDELKAMKKAEIESGTATIEGYSEFVTVREKKEKK